MRTVDPRSNRNLRTIRVVAALAVMAVAASCSADRLGGPNEGGETAKPTFEMADQIAPAAVRLPFPRRPGRPPATFPRTPRIPDVNDDVLRPVPKQPAWRTAFERTYAVYEATPEYFRDPAINLACQWRLGLINSEKEFDEAVDGEAISLALSPNKYLSFRYSVWQLRKALADATTGDRKAAVVVCYILDQATV
jgi:hypothetical protein